jgi:hypothetical protein
MSTAVKTQKVRCCMTFQLCMAKCVQYGGTVIQQIAELVRTINWITRQSQGERDNCDENYEQR